MAVVILHVHKYGKRKKIIISYKNKIRNTNLIDYSKLIVIYGLVNVNANETQVGRSDLARRS